MRYRQYLAERYRALLGYSGGLLLTISLLLLLPVLALPAYPDEADIAAGLALAGFGLAGAGFLLWWRLSPRQSISLSMPEGTVIVVFVWAVAALAGAVPFMLVGGLSATQAIFEATSGWTTTGLSVMDVEATPRLLLLYRSFIQLGGGAGFVIITISAMAGPSGAGLSMAEGRSEQLLPHVRQSAELVMRIYLSYVVVGVLALRIAGMGWFDAVNHAFTAIATGGFSTQADSIGHWDSAAIEAVIIVLMLLGQLNFLTAYTLLRRRYRAVVMNGEVRLMAVLLPVVIVSLLVFITAATYPTLGKAVRVAVFESVSALSGTGFSTVSYLGWNEFGWLVIVLLMVVGGGSGSTAGGIKQARIYTLYKGLIWEIRRAFLPRHMVNQPVIWQGDQREFLNDQRLRQASVFVFLYIATLFFGTGLIALHGFDLDQALFEFASALGTVGLSVGVTRADSPDSLLWVQTFGMFLGRLEFFAVIIGGLKLASDGRILAGLARE